MQPIGRDVGTTAKALDRAFTRALAERGGSLSSWLILLALKQQRRRTQQEVARAVGIEGPTLTGTSTASSGPGSFPARATPRIAAPYGWSSRRPATRPSTASGRPP